MEETFQVVLMHLWVSLKLTLTQIFILFGPGLVLAYMMQVVAKRVQIEALLLLGIRPFLYLFGWLGTSIHELGHAAMCVIFRHRILEMKLFRPDPATGALGYVRHAWNSGSLYQVAGNFFIGIGPVIFGTIVIYFAALFLISDSFFLSFSDLKIDAGSFHSFDSIMLLLANIYDSFIILFFNLFTVENLKRWQFYVFVYILFCTGSFITLSRSDIEGAARGFAVFFVVMFAINVTALFFGGISAGYFIWITQYYSVFYTVMIFTLLMNALLLVPLSVLTKGKSLRFRI